jgi:hypothetical protein
MPMRERTPHAAIATLAALALCVHGYHPFAEDGGLYLAGAELLENPALFPHERAFITPHLAYSVFAPLLVGAEHVFHVGLPYVAFAAYLIALWLMAYAGWRLADALGVSRRVAIVAAAFLCALLTVPVAGTSLLLFDPYLTARSFSTPLCLLALAWSVRATADQTRKLWLRVLAPLAIAALFHPLMAAYGAALCLCVAIAAVPAPRTRRIAWSAFVALAFAIAGAVQWLAPAEPPAAQAAVVSRYYWFLSQWQWFELLGLAAPALLLWWIARSRLATEIAQRLASACLALTLLATTIALLFAQEHFAAHAVARLQPLRALLMVYAAMLLLLAVTLQQWVEKRWPAPARGRLRGSLIDAPILCVAAAMFFVQRTTFPLSVHIELPHAQPRNPWVQAFVWARENTPADALFALDAKYVNTDGEDAQSFRALAQRDMLPDYSKDGGETAITPRLAPAWLAASNAQFGLSEETDAERQAKLAPFGATWVVLHANAQTALPCPYTNATVKVCKLR